MTNLILTATSGLIIFIAAIYLFRTALRKKEAWSHPWVLKKETAPKSYYFMLGVYMFFALAGLIISALSIMMAY